MFQGNTKREKKDINVYAGILMSIFIHSMCSQVSQVPRVGLYNNDSVGMILTVATRASICKRRGGGEGFILP